MERRHLRYFVAVAEEGHFARAAERLGIAPPTLTVQIQEIERSLQAQLLSRTKRRVTLTPAGEAFLAEARTVLDRFERAESVGRRAGRGEIGRIEIGYVGSAAFAGVLQEQIGRFRRRFPDVDLRSRELPMAEVPDMLAAGSLDVGFVRLPMELSPGLRHHMLAEDDFCVALPGDHLEAGRDGPIRPAALEDEAFIVPEQPSGTLEVARQGGFQARLLSSPGSLAAVLTQVSLGYGVSVVPTVAAAAMRIPNVVFRSLPGAAITSEVAAIFRARESSAAASAFVGQIVSSPVRRLRFDDLDAQAQS